MAAATAATAEVAVAVAVAMAKAGAVARTADRVMVAGLVGAVEVVAMAVVAVEVVAAAAVALATAAAVEATVQTAVGMVEAVAMVAVTASGAGSYPVDYECRPRMSVLDAAAVVLEPGRRLVVTLFQRLRAKPVACCRPVTALFSCLLIFALRPTFLRWQLRIGVLRFFTSLLLIV